MRVTPAQRERHSLSMGVMICTLAGIGFGSCGSTESFVVAILFFLYALFFMYLAATLPDDDD